MLELIVCQRKVFTTPVHNEADDASVTNILPSDRGLNKVRGCAAVSIGENVTEAFRASLPKESPSESGPCVKTMLADTELRLILRLVTRQRVREVARGDSELAIKACIGRAGLAIDAPFW